ncbi:multidrug effflux MFS transporter [Microbacterium sp. NPDC058389]|uniref:multidrug effflux MFS transporter n=1 Tax=Microbacterium sp. NPDC058389 TaxID=3346475 RepID=UPI00364F8B97
MSPLRAMLVLGALEAFGPLSMDLYLPQLPQLADTLGASDALAQATMSACMLGLGLGQLIAGPLSDRHGRRRPLLVGVAAFAVLSLVCALAPTIEVLLVARALQGIAGSAGIVIALAVARDLYRGAELSRMLSLLLLVSGSAPVIAPLVGGQLAHLMDWRGVFGVLAGIGVALFAVVLFALPESLEPARRHAGGVRDLGGHLRVVSHDRLFVAVLVAASFGGAAFFTYLSMSSFVLEGQFGLTPQLFSLVFAANAVASIAGGQVSRALVRRTGAVRIYLVGVTACAAVAALAFAMSLWGLGLVAVVASLVLYLFSSGLGGPNSSTLALAHHGPRAGTAAAFLGFGQFAIGPIIAPLVSLAGTTAVVMTATMAIASGAAAVVAWCAVRPVARTAPPG